MKYLGTTGNPSLRSVAEGPIIDMMLVGGWAYEVQGGNRQDATEATRVALARWQRAGLPASDGADGQPRYDPVEVLNFMKWSGLRHGDTFWSERYMLTGRRFVLEQFGGQLSPGPFTALPAEEFTFVLTRRFNLSSFEPGKPLRLRLPLPIEDATLRNLELSFTSDFAGQVEYHQDPGRLEARFAAPDARQVSIGYRAKFRLDPGLAGAGKSHPSDIDPLDAAEFELYTRFSEGLISVTPRILSLAKELGGEGCTTREMVSSFWDYLMDHLLCGSVHYDEIDLARPMDWLLENGWYDCHLGSALLVSLCRARKIPARIINGYLLYPLSPTIHFWNEIWIEGSGWTPFDLLSWNLSRGGRDSTWRNCFAGTLDYRVKTQCLPRTFVGPMSLRLPPQWHMLTEPVADGIRITMADAISGTLAYFDDISVRRGRPPG
jgi:hypothetical protein